MNCDQHLHTSQQFAVKHVRGRYAPSPTGRLHLGNLRTALVAWLQTRLQGGEFILRIEDLDKPRIRSGSTEAILADLTWLGLDWDEGPDIGGPRAPYTQSHRQSLYQAALDKLTQQHLIFPCYCSRKDIALAASAPHAGEEGAIYPGICRNEPSENFHHRTPALRYCVPDETFTFVDAIAGMQQQHLAHEVGDFVVRRADGLYAYQLAVVVDDILMGITDVVRGADLLSSTARQLALFQALGTARPPRYWHVPLVCDELGQRLSKRENAASLEFWRNAGMNAAQLVGRFASDFGWLTTGAEISARELLTEINLERFIAALQAQHQHPVPNEHNIGPTP